MDGWSVPLFSHALNVSNSTTTVSVDGIALFEALLLEMQIQSRASVVITTCFSVATSVAVITSILHDSWQRSKRRVDTQDGHLHFLIMIPPVHILPFAIAIASIMQGAVFMTTQSIGLQQPFIHNCRAVSQSAWTAAWIPAYALLALSVETTYRCFKPYHFRRLNGYLRVFLRWLVIGAATLFTWIPSQLRKPDSNTCLAYLPRWVETWSDIGAVLSATLIFIFVASVCILRIRLARTGALCHDHKQAAKELVWYLIANGILQALTLPFWVQSAFAGPVGGKIESMASLALSLFGLVNATLYMVLRIRRDDTLLCSGKSRCALGPQWDELGSSDLALARQITKPIDLERNNSAVQAAPAPPKEEKRGSFKPLSSAPTTWSRFRESRISKSNDTSTANGTKSRLGSLERHFPFPRQYRNAARYSVFPRRPSQPTGSLIRDPLINTTGGDNETLLPPQPAFTRHRRESSEISAATVQIGLRLSNVAMPSAMQQEVHTTVKSPTLKSPSVHQVLSCTRASQSTPSLTDFYKSTVLPPTPLTVPKRDKGVSPLRCSERPGDQESSEETVRASSLKKPWPLPDRLSLLPKKTYRQGSWI